MIFPSGTHTITEPLRFKNGDVWSCPEGTYRGMVQGPRFVHGTGQLTIQGSFDLTAKGKTTDESLIVVSNGRLTARGLTFRNLKGKGIHCTKSTNIVLDGITSIDASPAGLDVNSTGFDIYLEDVHTASITNCDISSSCGSGIAIYAMRPESRVYDITIKDNLVRNSHNYGIIAYAQVDGAEIGINISNNRVSNIIGDLTNTATNNKTHGDGIYLQRVHTAIVKDNIIWDTNQQTNNTGTLTAGAIGLNNVLNALIENNHTRVGYAGIDVAMGPDHVETILKNNTCSGYRGYALGVRQSNKGRLLLHGNRFQHSKWNVWMAETNKLPYLEVHNLKTADSELDTLFTNFNVGRFRNIHAGNKLTIKNFQEMV